MRIEPPVSEPRLCVDQTRRYRRRGTARRAAGDVIRVPGIARSSGDFIVSGRSKCKLDHVQPRDIERAGGIQPLENGCRHIRQERGADARTASADAARPVKHILVCQWDAVQRSARTPSTEFGIGFGRGRSGVVGIDRGHTAQAVAMRTQSRYAGFRHVHGRDVARRDRRGGLREA